MKRYEFKSALPRFLDPHQKDGVRFILTRSRSYLAHAPGAGKTCEAIIAAKLSGSRRTLFIVPPSLAFNWVKEIQKFAPGMKNVTILPDSIITQSRVQEAYEKFKPDFVAVDEASRFKEPTSQRTIALFGGTLKGYGKTKGLIRNAKHAVLLDGSPMPNRPMELWAPTIAMCPEAIDRMTQEEFGFKYCGAKLNDFGRWEFKHASNEKVLQKKLRKEFMHVVTENELDHPERLRSIVYLNEDVRSQKQKTWEAKNITTLQKISGEENSQGDLARHRHELGLQKVKLVAKYVQEKLEDGESVLLFAWHKDVICNLAKMFPGPHGLIIDGSVQMAMREVILRRFQTGECRLIVGNIAAMGRGVNLQRADRVVFAEYSWCDETNKQAEKRASRRGNKKKFTKCDYLCAPDSLDEVVLRTLFRKEKTVERVIG